jgi:hypothetical protein
MEHEVRGAGASESRAKDSADDHGGLLRCRSRDRFSWGNGGGPFETQEHPRA